MEPITIGIFVGLGLLFASAIVFWEHILSWAHDSLLPWFDEHLPQLAPLLRDAFVVLNNAVMAVRKAAVQAWRAIRPRLLKMVETFEREGSKYFLKVTSYLREKLAGEQVEVVESRRSVSLDELPADVQAAFLRGKVQQDFDVTREQDEQIDRAANELAYAT